jgi:hypothetical protein
MSDEQPPPELPQCETCKACRLETRERVERDGRRIPELWCPHCADDHDHLYALLASDLKFCGCGDPEAAYSLVRDILNLAPFYDDWKAVRDLFGEGPASEGAYYLVLYLIDGAGLIEHGGSIGGSWLTPKGTHYRELMRMHGYRDADELSGFPHDGDGCGPGCRHWEASTDEWEKRRAAEEKPAQVAGS